MAKQKDYRMTWQDAVLNSVAYRNATLPITAKMDGESVTLKHKETGDTWQMIKPTDESSKELTCFELCNQINNFIRWNA